MVYPHDAARENQIGQAARNPLMADAVAALVVVEPKPERREGRVFPRGTDPATRVPFHTFRHTAGSWLTIRGGFATISSGNPRAQQPEPDREIQPPGDGAYPGRPGPAGGAGETCRHGTWRGTIGRMRPPSACRQGVGQEILSF